MRIEQDSTGKINVPENAYYGAFTARAINNFQISGISAPSIFRKSLGILKIACTKANAKLGLLSKKNTEAILKAASEFTNGKYDAEFNLDIFQAGAGTPYNMNANEVIANRANEILGWEKGKYNPIHPNNHVNMGQSSNDAIPTATRIATLFALKTLETEIGKLIKSLEKKAGKFARIKKVARTHLQDAVPMTLGQEFEAYAEYMRISLNRIREAKKDLLILGIGGTAIGSGINAHKNFAKEVVVNLSELCKIKFTQAKNKFALTSSHTAFIPIISALKALATDLNKIANDLKILSSGPRAGLNELTLPEVQPGSSIMPAKVNPSIPECITQIYAQIMGCATTIDICCNEGHLELNTMTPTIMYNLLFSIQILTNGLKIFRKKCINGICANKNEITRLYKGSLCEATTLVPSMGYAKTAEIIKKALKTGKSIEDLK